jgi:hypothetical protein
MRRGRSKGKVRGGSSSSNSKGNSKDGKGSNSKGNSKDGKGSNSKGSSSSNSSSGYSDSSSIKELYEDSQYLDLECISKYDSMSREEIEMKISDKIKLVDQQGTISLFDIFYFLDLDIQCILYKKSIKFRKMYNKKELHYDILGADYKTRSGTEKLFRMIPTHIHTGKKCKKISEDQIYIPWFTPYGFRFIIMNQKSAIKHNIQCYFIKISINDVRKKK